MTTSGETETAVLPRGILQGDPEADRTRPIGIEKCAVLVRRHGAPNLGLLADHHALQQSGILEAELRGDLRVEAADWAGVRNG